MVGPKTPKVTVFIPVYNRERYIGEAMDSILAQSFTDFELLVVDDGSTDGSASLVEAYGDPRVRLVRNGSNLGIPRTRNRGLELARGEYIALLDSDDCACPDRLERQVAFLEAHPDHALVGAWGWVIDQDGRVLRGIKRQPVTAEEVRAHLLFRCCVSNRSLTGRTSVMRAYGYRNEFPLSQDYDLFVRVMRDHKLANLPEALVRGRVHDQQITVQTAELSLAMKRKIARAQLVDLGLEPDETDLDRHIHLGRMTKLGFIPDRAYLEWAETWLRRLQTANRQSRVHSEALFTEIVGDYWLKVCKQAARRIGLAVWIRFLRSPLCGGSVPSLWHRFVALRSPET